MHPDIEEAHPGDVPIQRTTDALSLSDDPATAQAGENVPPGDVITAPSPEIAPGGPACDLPLAPPATADAAQRGIVESELAEAEIVEPEVIAPLIPEVVEVTSLDWDAISAAVDPGAIRARMRSTVERMEALLDRAGGPRLLFDEHRSHADDRAIAVPAVDEDIPLWFIGDLHGDLLALEAALACIHSRTDVSARPRVVFLGDIIDDGGYGLEVLLRLFELMVDDPGGVCLVAGNHDEALHYDGARFSATVSPSDFTGFLNDRLAHEWVARAGKLAVRVFADAPRALFLPDWLLVAHGGFPLTDQHDELRATANWNDPRCLTDFVWTRAHPKARRKMPNRASRGSQFGHEDFAAFCALATDLGRPVTHMVRGHDHVDERWAIYPAYASHPVLTTNALSRQLDREAFGPYERVPTIARWVRSAVPQVYRLHAPGALVREVYPPAETDEAGA